MAGRKYGWIIYAKTGPAYAAMSAADRAKPGKAMESTMKKYAGKVDMVRRYWTGTFTHEATDVFVYECDDPAVMHAFNEDLNTAFAKAAGAADPNRFGATVHVSFGINPDADAPKRGRQ